jgi:hypothetical protein
MRQMPTTPRLWVPTKRGIRPETDADYLVRLRERAQEKAIPIILARGSALRSFAPRSSMSRRHQADERSALVIPSGDGTRRSACHSVRGSTHHEVVGAGNMGDAAEQALRLTLNARGEIDLSR